MTTAARAVRGDAAGFPLALAGVLLLTVMDAVVKELASTYPTLQLVLLRFALTAVLVAPVVLVLRLRLPPPAAWRAHFGRSLLIVAASSMFFHALGRLPLTEVFVLAFTAPVFTAVFAALMLGERIGWRTAAAIGVAFAGMAVIALGGAPAEAGRGFDVVGYLCAVGAPVAYALGLVLLRFQATREPPAVIVLVQSTIVTALLAVPVALDGVPLQPSDGDLILALGVLSTLGYLAFATGLRLLPAARFAVAEYTGLIWATLFGILFFDEVPTPAFWAGAALIVVGCLVTTRARSVAPA